MNTKADLEIRDFERRARKALDDFFEDYKTRALIKKDEYPLRHNMVDWFDLLCDHMLAQLMPYQPGEVISVETDERTAPVVSNRVED